MKKSPSKILKEKNISHFRNCRKISIVGSPASGKSTLSKELSELLNIPCIRMSDIDLSLKYKIGRPPSDDEWQDYAQELLTADKWLTDGYMSKSLDLRFKLSDSIIFIDIPLIFCLRNAFNRGLKNMFLRSETVHYTYNKTFFSRIAYALGPRIYRRVFIFHIYRKQRLIESLYGLHNEKVIIVIKNRKQMKDLIHYVSLKERL